MKDQVKLLLDQGVDPFAYSISGANCLHAAAEEGRYSILITLLKCARSKARAQLAPKASGAKKVAPLKSPHPLGLARKIVQASDQTGEVSDLKQERQRVDTETKENLKSRPVSGAISPPLHRKANYEGSSLSIMDKEAIYESKHFQNMINSLTIEKIETPLMLASKMVNYCGEKMRNHYEKVIRLLISHKANVTLTNYKGWSALNYYRQP